MDDKLFCLIIIALIKVIELLAKGLLSRNGKKKLALQQREETTTVNPGNPNDKPGKAPECLKHMTALAGIRSDIRSIKEDIKDNIKPNIRDIFRRLNK